MYDESIRYVYAIVRRYISNDSDHQDIIQEIFARVFLSIDSFDEKKGEFKFWLRRITINMCIQHYKQQAASPSTFALENVSEASAETVGNSRFELSKDEIKAFLQKMPEGYRQIFMLVIMDDYSHQEVSELLSISPETSRSQLHRAKKWLQINLSKHNLKQLVGEV